MSAFNDLSNSMADAVAQLSPALVRVEARRRMPATGLIHSAEGIIVTAHHVVESDEHIRIFTEDGAEHSAVLVGRDPHNDLAVLKVNASGLPSVAWGENAALRVGALVLAVGRPSRHPQATLGTVSALVAGTQKRKQEEGKRGRRGAWGQVLVDGYIQTDVVMYPGFSGGALLGGDGKVHGIVTSGFGAGMSIAVPVATIRNSVATLLAHGKMKQGYIGVGVQAVRLQEALAASAGQTHGLLITSVEAGSPSDKGGVLVGDILLGLDGESTEQVDELLALLWGERVGKQVSARILRGGAVHELSVTVGERA